MKPRHVVYIFILILVLSSAFALSATSKGGATPNRGRCCIDVRADGG